MLTLASNDPVVARQRRRILAAATEVFGRQGFDRTAVEDIIGPAGVSRRTFYDLFKGKDDAFRVAYERALDLLSEQVELAFAGEGDWPKGIAAAVSAAVEWAESEPSPARLLAGGPRIAGPRAAYCHDRLVRRFEPCLRGGPGKAVPPAQSELLIAGIAGVASLHLEAGDKPPLASLTSELIELTLTPYVGAEQARQVARSHCPQQGDRERGAARRQSRPASAQWGGIDPFGVPWLDHS